MTTKATSPAGGAGGDQPDDGRARRHRRPGPTACPKGLGGGADLSRAHAVLDQHVPRSNASLVGIGGPADGDGRSRRRHDLVNGAGIGRSPARPPSPARRASTETDGPGSRQQPADRRRPVAGSSHLMPSARRVHLGPQPSTIMWKWQLKKGPLRPREKGPPVGSVSTSTFLRHSETAHPAPTAGNPPSRPQPRAGGSGPVRRSEFGGAPGPSDVVDGRDARVQAGPQGP